MRTIEGTVKTWISRCSAEYGYDKDRVECYSFSNQDMSTEGWTLAGSATIEIHLENDDTLVNNMVDALKAQKQKVQADAQVKINAIEERIQSLLALPAPVQS